MRKANVILEYGILLMIVVGAVAGVNTYLKRHIQARIVHEAEGDFPPLVQGLSVRGGYGPGQGLEWASSMTIGGSSSTFTRNELPGENLRYTSGSSSSSTTLQAPVPSIQGWSVMEHKGSALHAQDAPSAATVPDYPDLEYKEWEDQGWPLH
jgi:hypothetical protein